MKRIVKHPTVRRNELIDCAQQLFLTKGYEATSVADIINTVGIAKGTFYHYFDSKQAVLSTVALDLATRELSVVKPIFADDNLDALSKWTLAIAAATQFELENQIELMGTMRLLLHSENLRLRYELNQQITALLVPEIQSWIEQGIREGVFITEHSLERAELILTIFTHWVAVTLDLIISPEKHENLLRQLTVRMQVVQSTIEQILGAAPNSLPLFDVQLLAEWCTNQ